MASLRGQRRLGSVIVALTVTNLKSAVNRRLHYCYISAISIVVMPVILLLDLNSERPLYRQIYDQLVEALALGRLLPGSHLPTVRRLAADLSVNLHTVRRAYGMLAKAGLISLERHNGARVLALPPPSPTRSDQFGAQLRRLVAEGLAGGLRPDLINQLCQQVVADLSSSPS